MVRVNESLSQGETVRRLGKELDALMGPQQQRKIKQLELENQTLHDEVLTPLFLTPCLYSYIAHAFRTGLTTPRAARALYNSFGKQN